MRGCGLDGVVGAQRLRGVAMSWQDVVGNASTFAAAIGIRLLED
jgi:hypothetical protein